jgi:hypothetical protein
MNNMNSDTEKKRGRPKKINSDNEQKEKRPKGRPRTNKPLSERRKYYDLRFSLKKLSMTEDQINEIISTIEKMKKDKETKDKEEQSKKIDVLHEKKDN